MSEPSKPVTRPQPPPRAATGMMPRPPLPSSPVSVSASIEALPTRIGQVGVQSVVGLRLPDNEDVVLSLPDVPVFAVADGSGGAWPAEIVVKTLSNHRKHILEFEAKVASEGTSSSRLAVGHFFESVFNEAGQAVNAEMHKRGEGRGTSAAVALTFMGPFAYVAHIGDSRGYLWRGGKLRALTTDQTLAMLRLKRGEITPEEYADSPFKKTLTQAFGVTPELRPDIAEVKVAPGDVFLLCSDGLHRLVSDERIAEILAAHKAKGLQAAADALCAEADARGGKDNTSVILVPVESAAKGVVSDSELENDRERFDIARILGKCFLFQGIDDAERLLIAPYFEYVNFAEGDTICTEGEPGDSIYIVVSGKMRVTFRQAHLIDLGPGGYAGEIALARIGPRTATIVAAEKTMTLKLVRARFLEIIRRRPALGVQLALPLLDNVGQRIMDVRTRLYKVQNVVAGRLDDVEPS